MRGFLNGVFYVLLTLAVLMLLYNLGKMLTGAPGNTPGKTLLLVLLDPINWLLLIVWVIRRNVTGRRSTVPTDAAKSPHQ